LHPALERALKILSDRFGELILDEQDVFLKAEGWKELLDLIPNKGTLVLVHARSPH
jgi:hypothetical protein